MDCCSVEFVYLLVTELWAGQGGAPWSTSSEMCAIIGWLYINDIQVHYELSFINQRKKTVSITLPTPVLPTNNHYLHLYYPPIITTYPCITHQ